MPSKLLNLVLTIIALCCVGAPMSFAQAQTSEAVEDFARGKSLYLEQAYEHYGVRKSELQSTVKRGIELYTKNDMINQAYAFLKKRREGVNVDEIEAVIVDMHDNKNVVHFLGKDVTGGVKGVFGVEITNKRLTYVHFPKVPEYLERMYKVYTLANRSVKGPCELDYNMIVIQEGQEYLAYNVVAEPHNQSMILGGHFLLRISEDPKTKKFKIDEYRPYDTMCVPISRSMVDKEGRISINYAAKPNEIHSFLTMQYEQPIQINTGTSKWVVRRGLVSRIP